MKIFDNKGNEVTIDTSKELGSGGEGIIYKMSKDRVVKIYHSHIKPTINQTFLNELSKLSSQFIKPIDLYYNIRKQIVGFSMPYLDMGSMFPFTNLFSKAECNKNNYDSDFKKKVFDSLIKGLKEAHSHDVVIGDLNPYNLLFTNNGDVYFIDTDSYQTNSKPHSGIMLNDIRDWLHDKIDKYSDYFSLSILTFNASTFMHPYKGVHKKYKTIEERVLKHLSILSKNTDIIIPSFYEPITNSRIHNQFLDIFQYDRRFIIDLDDLKIIQKSTPKIVTSIVNSLSIKQIQDNVKYYEVINNMLITFDKNNVMSQYDISVHSTFTTTFKPWSPHPLLFKSGDYFIGLSNLADSYTIFDLNIKQLYKNNIYIPSLVKGDEVLIQSISGQKWLLWAHPSGLFTLRTKYDIRDAYKRDKMLCIKIKEGNRIKTYLATVDGMSLELGPELDDMRRFCVLNNLTFVPEDKRLDVYSFSTKVAEISCDYITENSILTTSKAGIICQTDDKVILINKL